MPRIITTDSDVLNDPRAPWWSKLSTVAAVTLIAMGLVYFMAVRMDNQMQANATALNQMRENLVLHSNDARQTQQNIEYYMRVQNALTQQLCVNAARNNADRDDCFKN